MQAEFQPGVDVTLFQEERTRGRGRIQHARLSERSRWGTVSPPGKSPEAGVLNAAPPTALQRATTGRTPFRQPKSKEEASIESCPPTSMLPSPVNTHTHRSSCYCCLLADQQ